MNASGDLTRNHKLWRFRIFTLTWLAYAGLYFCRKNFSVAMPFLSEDLGYTKLDFANVIAVYSAVYMLGQFLNGYLSDRFGPRKIVSIGLVISILANIFMGFAASIAVLIFLGGLNGLGQSAGWSGLIKNMTTWFRHKERGVVMAWWTTCYVVGGFVGTIFATYWLTHETILVELGWKRGFWFPALVLLVIFIIYSLFVRNKPSDAGLSEIADGNPKVSKKDIQTIQAEKREKREVLKMVLSNSAIRTAAVTYFFLKLTRYTFLFWLPTYMTEALGYSVKTAGYSSSAYELAGFAGVVIAGYVSDKLFNANRFPVSAIMMYLLAVACLVQPYLSQLGLVYNIVGLSMIGLMTFGPDSLLSAATAMDLGGRRGAATAAGVINGIGSLGQILSPFLVAFVTTRYGWDSLFYVFVGFALIGGTLLASKWNYEKESLQ